MIIVDYPILQVKNRSVLIFIYRPVNQFLASHNTNNMDFYRDLDLSSCVLDLNTAWILYQSGINRISD